MQFFSRSTRASCTYAEGRSLILSTTIPPHLLKIPHHHRFFLQSTYKRTIFQWMESHLKNLLRSKGINLLHSDPSLLVLNKPSGMLVLPDRYDRLLPDLDMKDITAGKIGRLRNEVTKRLADELKEIDGIVRRILRK